MAAQVARFQTTRREAPTIVEAVVAPRSTPIAPLLPFPAPLLDPDAVEALLLAFRPFDRKPASR